jgi:hypothetical protein
MSALCSVADSGDEWERLVAQVADRVALLPLKPRTARWTTLSACVLDAVWSLGARYDSVVVPLVYRALDGVPPAALTAAVVPEEDPYPLPRLLQRFPEEALLRAATGNAQRTSTRNGVTKAQAVLSYAAVLIDHGVEDLRGANQAMADTDRMASIEAGLRTVPGDGAHGIRRGYLWMLCGDDERIKPDRMVMRWLADFRIVDPACAAALLVDVAALLTRRAPAGARPVTAWQVDHAIWLAARTRKPKS